MRKQFFSLIVLILFYLPSFCHTGGVQLVDYIAYAENDKVHLELVYNSTVNEYTELNGIIFIVKSLDFNSLDTIHQIPAQLGTDIKLSETDENPFYGTNYYRLIITQGENDIDQTPWLPVKFFPAFTFNYSVYPNPVENDVLKIEMYSRNLEVIDLVLYDARGKQLGIIEKKYGLEGQEVIEFPVTQLPKGIYFLFINHNSEEKRKAITIYKQ